MCPCTVLDSPDGRQGSAEWCCTVEAVVVLNQMIIVAMEPKQTTLQNVHRLYFL